MGSIIIDGWKDRSYFASWNAKQTFVNNPTLVSAIYQDSLYNETNDERNGRHLVTTIVVNDSLQIITFTDMQDIVDLMTEKHCITDCRKQKNDDNTL